MKTSTKILVAIMGAGIASFSQAADFEDYARVVSVTPQVEQVNQPRQQCWVEQVPAQQPHQHGVGGSIIGGLTGGLIGSQFGRGNGRTAAAAVGAMTGAIVGNRIENDDDRVAYAQPVQRCQMVDHWETRNNGYAVAYRYRGHTYTSVLPYEPGEQIRVQVSVTPRI